MASIKDILITHSVDEIICDFSLIKDVSEVKEQLHQYLEGQYQTVLAGSDARTLFAEFQERLETNTANGQASKWRLSEDCPLAATKALLVGLSAFDAFLQANVTGPPLTATSLLYGAEQPKEDVKGSREECFRYLDVAGLSVYQYVPHIELYAFAKAIFTGYFPRNQIIDSKWMRIRINAYHQRLLSSGMSNIRLSDCVAEIQASMEQDMKALEREIMREDSTYSTEAKVQFLLEKAQIYIMQGLDVKAKDNVKHAKEVSRFSYALSAALGKRTKFQQNDIAQLVVFARSHDDGSASDGKVAESAMESVKLGEEEKSAAPNALNLDDDTLLESIEFTKTDKDSKSDLPAELADLEPNEQPQLKPLDQIILLTEATLKDASIASDKLTNEEILPFAVRVLNDKPTNWQIYTQALLVRSRIESHRSRTQERSVLQLQAIVDQIIADTEAGESAGISDEGIPQIQVTQFFPKAKESETAPIQERLKYIYQLNTPTRWEIETELAYAWSKTGSLVSALEIFKRLRLWAEVALCYHSIDQSGRALQIIRRQLYHSKKGPGMDKYAIDAEEVLTEKWDGEIRSPPPPHAPRLWCILGDLEQNPECWERAWEISGKHYARAQRTLGEYYSRQGNLDKARDAYMAATMVNRQNGDTWSRLGDIDLASGNWDGAVIAFQQAIMIDDDDAKTYSNLGSALLSKYDEIRKMERLEQAARSADKTDIEEAEPESEDDEENVGVHKPQVHRENPKDILRQALIAYRKGASLQHDNWQIWDNVITIAGRMSPPAFAEILMAMRAIIRIRAPTVGEDAVDIAILRALVAEVLSCEKDENPMTMENGIFTAPRGSIARAVPDMVDAEIVPLITKRAELWALVEKLKFYRRDYAGALAAAEKRWRIATAGEEWLEDVDGWKQAGDATDGLVSALENYGQQEKHDGSGEVEKGWKMKARSAVRGILGKAKDNWEDSDEYEGLKERLEEIKNM